MFDSKSIGLPCPKCGHKTSKTIAWIKAHDEFVCDSCDANVRMNKQDLLAGLDQAEESIAKLRKSLGSLGKRR